MRTAFVAYHGMNLIEDERARRLQHPSSAFTCEKDVERFRSGDHDVRRPLDHRSALSGWRVARPNECAYVNFRQTHLAQLLLDSFERNLQVALDVVAQRLQGRDINYVSGVVELAGNSQANQVVNCRKESSERFSGTGGRSDKSVAMCFDCRPGELLRLSGCGESLPEPTRDGWMENF